MKFSWLVHIPVERFAHWNDSENQIPAREDDPVVFNPCYSGVSSVQTKQRPAVHSSSAARLGGGIWIALLVLAALIFPNTSRSADRPNRVLELDGVDACVELPAYLYTNDVVTIEGWVKCRRTTN